MGLGSSYANEEIIIEGKAPEGMQALETEMVNHDGMPESKGSHGYSGFCYKKEIYIVYSVNLLGHGYQISNTLPKDHECVETNNEIKGANKLGIRIGMNKQAIERIIGINGLANSQVVIWLSDIYYDGQRFDLQTYADFKFIEGQLVWLSVFTTETN